MGQEENIEEGSSARPLLNEAKAVSSVTPVVVLSVLVSVCGSFCYGCATGYSSAAMSPIMEELGLSVSDYSLFGSLLTLGGIIGALFSGKAAVLLGRKLTMFLAEMFCIFGWLAIAFAKDARWLDIARFSLGIGVGFISYVVPVYIAEISPKQLRGGFTFSNQLLLNLGVSGAYFVGNFVHWRTLALLSAIPCLVHAVCVYFIPESPRWLEKMGRRKESEMVLQRLRGKEEDVSKEADDIREIMETLDAKSGILDIFQKKYAHAITVGVGLMLLQQLSGSAGVAYYASNIITLSGFPTKIGTTVLSVVLIPKPLLGLALVDTWGRRPLLMASAIGMCFGCLLLGLSSVLRGLNLLQEITPIASFVAIVVYAMTYAVGLGGLPWIIMSEIFPMNVKVSAGSLVTFTNWSASWFITFTFNFMLEWSLSGTFFVFAVICGGTIVFVWFLVPETKGLTLEEIQSSNIQSTD